MSALEVLIGIAGLVVTVLVVAAMILITPRGQVELHGESGTGGHDLVASRPASRTQCAGGPGAKAPDEMAAP